MSLAPAFVRWRARSRRGLLTGLALLVLAGTVLVSLTIASAGVTATRASRAAIDDALGGAPAWEILTRIADDPGTQDARVRGIVEEMVPIPTLTGRRLVTENVSVDVGGATESRPVGAVPEGAVAVDGSWPGAGELLVPAGLAAVGETVTLEGTPYTVSGTWERPVPAVSGTPTASEGPDPLLLADDDAVVAVDDAPFVAWDVRLDSARIELEALRDLATLAPRLRTELKNDPAVAVRGLQITDGLETSSGQLAETLAADTATARAVSLVPAGFLVAVAGLAILQFVQLLALTRGEETRMLRSRGATPAQLGAAAGREHALVAALGAGPGAFISLAILLPQPGGTYQWPTVVTVAVGAVLWTVAAAVAVSLSTGRSLSLRSGRAGRAIGAGALVVLAALAALSGRRFAELAGVVTVGAEGTRADPLAILALGAALLVGGVLVVVLLAPATRLVASAAARTRGLGLVLAARQAARRLPALVTPALLVAVAAASLTAAAAFSGTTHAQRWADARVRGGADVRLVLPGPLNAGSPSSTSPDLTPILAADGARSAATVRTVPFPVAGDEGTLVALPVDTMGDILGARIGEEERAAIVRPPSGGAVTEGQLGIEVPLRLVGVEGVAPAGNLTVDLEVLARFAGADGGAMGSVRASVDATVGAAGTTASLAMEVPAAATQLTAVDVRFQPRDPGPSIDQILSEQGLEAWNALGEISEEYQEAYEALATDGVPNGDSVFELEFGYPLLTADGAEPAALSVVPESLPETIAVPRPDEPFRYAGEFWTGQASPSARFVPDTAVTSPLPVLVTGDLAAALGLEEGSPLGVTVDGPSVRMTVAGIVDAVPGTAHAMAVLADQGSLVAHLAAERDTVNGPNEVWVMGESGTDLSRLADAVLAAAGIDGATIALAEPSATDPTAPIAATFRLAALGALALALVGAGAAAAAQSHGRDGELAVLRALGHSARRAAASRASEVLAVALPSAVLGVLSGWAASTLLVPALAREATRGFVDVAPAVAWGELGLALALLLGGLLAVGAVVASALRRRMTRVGVGS